MKNRKVKTLSMLLLSFGISNADAQQAITTTGGNVSGIGGTVSYTVGQIAYATENGTNGTVAHGVQQPYELWVLTGVDNHFISLKPVVYPNPATNFLTLDVGDADMSDLSFELSDISGNLIESRKISSAATVIRMDHLSTGAYKLKIMNNSKEVKTFKIIKN